jgi:mono/diheme cytochrome c family protein
VGGPQSVAKVFTDGHIYTTITMGRGRMPSYRRIAHEDRWDIVNYLRDLNGQGGRN